jgi:hypothetical protein
MSTRIYFDTNNFISVKATCFTELLESFKKSQSVLDANFYCYQNKRVGPQVLTDSDLVKADGVVYVTDIVYPDRMIADETFHKDSRNKKYKYEDPTRNDGKSRNKAAQMKIRKIQLEKTLGKLQGVRNRNIKSQLKDEKNMKRYTGKDVKSEGHEVLDENVKEILMVENQLHKFAMDKLRRNQKKFLMKTARSNIVVV